MRIDHWVTAKQPMDKWATKSREITNLDRLLDSIANFTQAKTPALTELKPLARRSSDELGGAMSSAVFSLEISGGKHLGSYYRGFLVFAHGTDTYAIHYQTSRQSTDDKIAIDAIFAQLLTLKHAMVFHDQ